MKAISATERSRYDVLMKKIKPAVKTQREVSEGYVWDVNGKLVSMPEVAEWMAMERRCCSFLRLQLDASGSGTDYSVGLLGPEGVKQFLVSEFGISGKK
jgi:hypothetical protein